MIAALLIVLGASVEAPPPKQTLIFYNSRLALRDERPQDALRLWLLRNSVADNGPRGRYDEEFRSVVWAALGSLGLCQDGYPTDDAGGAGLWPIALHNWVVRAAAQQAIPSPTPFAAFEIGVQQRLVSLHDVLTEEELKTVGFFPTECLRVNTTMLDLTGDPSVDLTERLKYGRVLRKLLVHSLKTLVREKVESVAAIEARIFDLDLALSGLQTRQASQRAMTTTQRARTLGLSKSGAGAAGKLAAVWPEGSEQAEFLRKALTWRTSEWLTLNRQRRLFLFAQARPFAKDPAALDATMLSIIDELIARKEGAELGVWIASMGMEKSPARRAILTEGERGKRLLELEPATGFQERSVIALHRGVAYLEAGQMFDALRSFGYAMAHAEESRDPAVTLALARRWLSFVLARYETSDEVIAVLKALVPRQEYNSVIEDLVWRAALRADKVSFDRLVDSARRGGSFDARAARLKLLAYNKPGEMLTQLRDSAVDEPYLTLRFARQLLEKLEAEEPDVRAANLQTIKHLVNILDGISGRPGANKSQAQAAEELVGRARAIIVGLERFDTTPAARARAMGSRHEAFAGNIRLAPADPLPWPFIAPEPESPSAFVQLVLEPVEWRDPKDALVFGWRVTE